MGVREDGYHKLESVFAPLDWFDELNVVCHPASDPRVGLSCKRADDAVENRPFDVPTGPQNLAHQAAARFLERAGRAAFIELDLLKRIPAAAGLGGGSSDAGAVLWALNQIWPEDLSQSEIEDLALSLGADVPFFLDPKPSLVTGIGEVLQPLEDFPTLFLLLANPGEALATASVFQAWDALSPSLTPAAPGSTLRALSLFIESELDQVGHNSPVLKDLLMNDLEEAARHLCPGVGRLMAGMAESGAMSVSMSGSGATVFGVFDSLERAGVAQKNLALGDSGWSRLAASQSGR